VKYPLLKSHAEQLTEAISRMSQAEAICAAKHKELDALRATLSATEEAWQITRNHLAERDEDLNASQCLVKSYKNELDLLLSKTVDPKSSLYRPADFEAVLKDNLLLKVALEGLVQESLSYRERAGHESSAQTTSLDHALFKATDILTSINAKTETK
jgi:hypothetical protein